MSFSLIPKFVLFHSGYNIDVKWRRRNNINKISATWSHDHQQRYKRRIESKTQESSNAPLRLHFSFSDINWILNSTDGHQWSWSLECFLYQALPILSMTWWWKNAGASGSVPPKKEWESRSERIILIMIVIIRHDVIETNDHNNDNDYYGSEWTHITLHQIRTWRSMMEQIWSSSSSLWLCRGWSSASLKEREKRRYMNITIMLIMRRRNRTHTSTHTLY